MYCPLLTPSTTMPTRRLGVEFDGPAVTAIGAFEDLYPRFEEKVGRLARLFPLYIFTPWVGGAACGHPAACRAAGGVLMLVWVQRCR
jgi:hypothetical protein